MDQLGVTPLERQCMQTFDFFQGLHMPGLRRRVLTAFRKRRMPGRLALGVKECSLDERQGMGNFVKAGCGLPGTLKRILHFARQHEGRGAQSQKNHH